jgi:hypothetical protein
MVVQIIAILTIGSHWSKKMLKMPILFGELIIMYYFCPATGMLSSSESEQKLEIFPKSHFAHNMVSEFL